MTATRPGSIRQLGFSLVEVLVTMVVVALGLLGFAGLQANSLRSNTVALQRSYATMLAYDIIDSMRANAAAARAGSYHNPPAVANAMAAADLVRWNAAIAANLASGSGTVAVDGNNRVTITITWRQNPDANAAALSFRTESSL